MRYSLPIPRAPRLRTRGSATCTSSNEPEGPVRNTGLPFFAHVTPSRDVARPICPLPDLMPGELKYPPPWYHILKTPPSNRTEFGETSSFSQHAPTPQGFMTVPCFVQVNPSGLVA